MNRYSKNIKSLATIIISLLLILGVNYLATNYFPNFNHSILHIFIIVVLGLIIFILVAKNLFSLLFKK